MRRLHINKSDLVVIIKTIILTSLSIIFFLLVYFFIKSSLTKKDEFVDVSDDSFSIEVTNNDNLYDSEEDNFTIDTDQEDTIPDDSIYYAPVKYDNTYFATMVYWDQASGFDSVKNCVGCYNEISPFWYKIADDFLIVPFLEDHEAKKQIIDYCRQNDIDIYPIVSSERLAELLKDLVTNDNNISKHIDSIINVVNDNGYDGITLNYEGLQEEYKDNLSCFVEILAERLHQNNTKLRVFVNYKTFEGRFGSGAFSQDLKEIGIYADKVILMALDYYYPASDPGPIAPISFVEDTLSYTLQFVSADKLVLCIPLYGYDWGIGNARSVRYSDVEDVMIQYGVDSIWNSEYKSPFVKYTSGGVSHIIWFENTDSIKAKIDLANSYEVYNIDFFRLGGEVDVYSLISQ